MKSNNLKLQKITKITNFVIILCCFSFLLQSNNLPKFRNVVKIYIGTIFVPIKLQYMCSIYIFTYSQT